MYWVSWYIFWNQCEILLTLTDFIGVKLKDKVNSKYALWYFSLLVTRNLANAFLRKRFWLNTSGTLLQQTLQWQEPNENHENTDFVKPWEEHAEHDISCCRIKSYQGYNVRTLVLWKHLRTFPSIPRKHVSGRTHRHKNLERSGHSISVFGF